MSKIADNQWVYWPREHQMPDELTLYEGSWAHRAKVGIVNRASVLSHCRWHFGRPMPHQVLKSGRWIDVLIVGGIGDEPNEA